MDTKQTLSVPVIVGIIAAVVVILGFIGYRMLFAAPPTYGSGGVPPPCYNAGTCGKPQTPAPQKP